MWTAAWLSLATFIPLSDAPAPAEAFVRGFYAWYLARPEEPRGVADVLRERRSDLLPSLAAALEADEKESGREGELDGLDFDPFLNAQDVAPRYEVGPVAPVGRRSGTFRVPIYAFGAPGEKDLALTALVVCAPACRFVDFDYGEGRRLTGILRDLAAERKRLKK